MKTIKKRAKDILIIIIFLLVVYRMVDIIIVDPFKTGYAEGGILVALFAVSINCLVAGGFFLLFRWLLDSVPDDDEPSVPS